MKKVAILQSNYIPWKGYFHIIQKVDCFVFLDSTQYTVRNWRNRNQIKTPQGLLWLTVPTNGTQSMPINEVEINNSQSWQQKHLKALQRNYSECTFFDEYFLFFKNILLQNWKLLSALNQTLIKEICNVLNIETTFLQSTDLELIKGKNEKIISIVKQLGGTHYLTGPSAQAYIRPELFEENCITLEYMDYSHYPIYDQRWGIFSHNVSVLDLLFCAGSQSYKYIWGEKRY